MNGLLETKITINRIFLIIFAVIISVFFTWGAFATQTWAWLVAPPMNVVGVVLVVAGQRRRRETEGRRGMAISVLGAAFIVGSIWAAFMLGNRFQP